VEPPPPEPILTEVKPAEDTGVKLQPEPRKKKKVEKPREEVAPTPSRPPCLGVVGSAAQGEVGGLADFEFTYYLVLVRNRIAATGRRRPGS